MRKLVRNIFDFKLAAQSAPSLIATLFGMFFVSYCFKEALQHKKLITFPFLFQSSCILGFKGNVELSYVMDLSTKRKLLNSPRDFKKIAVTNSCNLIFQSLEIGFLVGCLSIVSILLKSSIKLNSALEMLATALLACLISTLVLIIFFIVILELSNSLSIDTENFLLPILNALNDILVVKSLYKIALNISHLSVDILFIVTIFILVFACFCYIIASNSKFPIPQFSLEAIAISLILNVSSGFILEKFSTSYPMIAPAYPVFSGMGSSIAFIFLHKKFTSMECNEILSINLKVTLLIVSLIISSFYIYIAHSFGIKYTHGFAVSFILMFVLQVLFLMKIIDKILKLLRRYNKNISADGVPITSSISDFLGIIILVGISHIGKLLKF